MKRFITAILALLYITTSTGASVNMHYCMGKLAGWGLGDTETAVCGLCGMEKSHSNDNGCCKDVHHFVKDNSAQKTTETAVFAAKVLHAGTPVFPFVQPLIGCVNVKHASPAQHPPPGIGGASLHIRNCVFRI